MQTVTVLLGKLTALLEYFNLSQSNTLIEQPQHVTLLLWL